MDVFLDIVNQGDLCFVPLLVLVLLFVGSKISSETQQHLGSRLAIGGFMVYCVYGFLTFRPQKAEDLLWVAIRGLLAAGLVLGFSWLLLPVVAFLYHHSIGALVDSVRDLRLRIRQRAQERRARREDARRLRTHAAEEERWRREAERRRPDEEARTRAQEEAQRRSEEAQRRREAARDRVELFYRLYFADIGSRVKEEWFNTYVERNMGDNHPADYVEQRAERLLETLQQALERTNPVRHYQSLAEIKATFEEQRQLILGSDLEDEIKEGQLLELQEEYDEQVKRFIKRRRS